MRRGLAVLVVAALITLNTINVQAADNETYGSDSNKTETSKVYDGTAGTGNEDTINTVIQVNVTDETKTSAEVGKKNSGEIESWLVAVPKRVTVTGKLGGSIEIPYQVAANFSKKTGKENVISIEVCDDMGASYSSSTNFNIHTNEFPVGNAKKILLKTSKSSDEIRQTKIDSGKYNIVYSEDGSIKEYKPLAGKFVFTMEAPTVGANLFDTVDTDTSWECPLQIKISVSTVNTQTGGGSGGESDF